MKRLLLLFFLIAGTCAGAQKSFEGMIRAEKSFAAWSVANGTREAFLKYLDSSGIIFDKGSPVNGIKSWLQRPKRPGILNWTPDYGEIAASNDFGYTTGPWTFQPGPSDTISASGRFITVWHADKNGDWKFLIDLGVSDIPRSGNELKRIMGKASPGGTPGSQKLLKAEEEFIATWETDPPAAYEKWLSTQSILNRNKKEPATDARARTVMVETTPAAIRYQFLGSGIASGGDLGYVYGTTRLEGKTEGYLRIWRKEREGWKIALEVLQF